MFACGAPAGCATLAVMLAVRPTARFIEVGATVRLVMPDGNAPTVIVADVVCVEAAKPLPAATVAVAVIVETPGATAVTTTEPFVATAPTVATDVFDEMYVNVALPAPVGLVTFGVIVTVCAGASVAAFGETVKVVMPGVSAETVTADDAT